MPHEIQVSPSRVRPDCLDRRGNVQQPKCLEVGLRDGPLAAAMAAEIEHPGIEAVLGQVGRETGADAAVREGPVGQEDRCLTGALGG